MCENATERNKNNIQLRAETILGSATRFGRASATRQYSVLGRHKPAETEY